MARNYTVPDTISQLLDVQVHYLNQDHENEGASVGRKPPAAGKGILTLIDVHVHQYFFAAVIPGRLSVIQAAAVWGRRKSLFHRVGD